MANLKPLGPDDPPLERLTPEQFQDLVFLLAHADDAGVVPIKAKDQGLDARLPLGAGRQTARGWQAKRFTGEIKFDQCLESIRRARAFWRPPHITFCFPRDLSAKEQEQFKQRLVDGFPELRLDFWSGTELKRRMRASEEGKLAARYFFGDPSGDLAKFKQVAAIGGELSSTQQALARLGIINEFLHSDPYFRLRVGFAEADAPPPPTPTPETAMRLEMEDQGTRVWIDASERYPGISQDQRPRAEFITEDEQARRAVRAELDRISREGGSAKLPSGLKIKIEGAPAAFAEFLPEDQTVEALEVKAGPRLDRKPEPLAVLLSAGDCQAAIDLGPAEPPADWTAALTGGFGGLELLMAFRISSTDSSRGESRMTFTHNRGVGTTMEQLASIELVGAVYEGQALSVADARNRQVIFDGIPAEEMSGPELEEVDGRTELLRALAELEAWTGQQLEPPPAWEEEDARALFAALALIRRPFIDSAEGVRIEVTYKPEALPVDVDGVHQFASTQELAIRMFGREIGLGQRMIHLPRGRFVDLDVEAQTVTVVAEDGKSGSVRLFAPGEPTPFGSVDQAQRRSD